jgi:hypothetical protein
MAAGARAGAMSGPSDSLNFHVSIHGMNRGQFIKANVFSKAQNERLFSAA